MLLALIASLVQVPDTTAARIYAVVLDSFQIRPGTTSLFVYGRTVTGVGHNDDLDYRNGVAGLSPLPDGLQADFEAKRSTRGIVPRNRFPTRFPGLRGMIGVSPIGFSTDRRWAMVMIDDPGGTVYYLAGLRDGRWVVVRSAEVRSV